MAFLTNPGSGRNPHRQGQLHRGSNPTLPRKSIGAVRLGLPVNSIVGLTVILIMVLGSGGFTSVIGTGGNDLSANFAVAIQLNTMTWTVIYPIALLSIALSSGSLVRQVSENRILVLALVWCTISPLWSSLPEAALLAAFQLVVLTLFALVAGERLGPEGLLKAVVLSSVIIIIGSIVFVFAYPTLGIVQDTQNKGAWRGIFHEKNHLGTWMSFATLSGLALFRGGKAAGFRFTGLTVALAAFALLIMSRSKTALIIVIVIAVVVLLAASLSRSRLQRLQTLGIVLVAGSALYGVLTLSLPVVMAELGKDETLTGRTELWDYISASIAARPMLGYGFASYWTSAESGGGLYLTNAIAWRPRSAHNAWLEIGANIGLIGVVFTGLYAVISVIKGTKLLFVRPGHAHEWALMVMLAMLGWGLVESNFFIHRATQHWLFVAAAAAVVGASRRPLSPAYPVQWGAR
jgi:exopolysaccharide production protein ExoQ